MRRWTMISVSLLAALAIGACSSSGQDKNKIPAYLANDPCVQNASEDACTGGCEWTALDSACPAGTECPPGVCVTPDPCLAHGDEASCIADTANGCAWAGVETLCPPGAACPDAGGYCFQPSGTDDCTCACPLYCPAGEDCPGCACDCDPSGGDTGGGTCTCACADCAPGAECPPCECSCEASGGSSDPGTEPGGDVCTCACPDCAPDTECPPCDCTCQGTKDPCADYVDEATCVADTANKCAWYAMGMPCDAGTTCRSGVCQAEDSSGGSGCACACPDCTPGTECPPCTCDCSGSGSGCVPGGTDSSGP